MQNGASWPRSLVYVESRQGQFRIYGKFIPADYRKRAVALKVVPSD